MPTGYTAKLVEKGQAFPEFVWTCARAFGALVMMRDDSLDAPIPEEFQPNKFHAKHLQEKQAEYERLEAMNAEEAMAYGRAEKKKRIAERREWLARNNAENARIDAMLEQVRQWQPPTPDHVGLKDFMIQQLEVSRNDTSWSEKELAETEAKDPFSIWQQDVSNARRSLEFAIKSLADEEKRVADRNAWLKSLRESVPSPSPETSNVK